VFAIGIGDPAWRRMQGHPCPVPVTVIAGGTPGMAGRSHGHYQIIVRLINAFPIRDTVPVVAGFHPGQPPVLQRRHPHPALGHDHRSRDESRADQQRHLHGPKASWPVPSADGLNTPPLGGTGRQPCRAGGGVAHATLSALAASSVVISREDYFNLAPAGSDDRRTSDGGNGTTGDPGYRAVG